MARALKQQAPAWVAEARRAPREDAQLHGEPSMRTTCLIRAAAVGDERRVRELLAAGALLLCIDGGFMSALHHASRNGSTQVVAALLEADDAGATVNAQDNTRSTALMWATFNGNEGAVRLLLARGALQELQDEDHSTALHYAATKPHAAIAELLCAAPGAAAALALRDKDGDSPLILAIREGGGDERTFAALLAADVAGATVDAQNVEGDTALIWATFNGNEGAVRLLLARGARQELQNKRGMTAMHVAASNGHTGVAEQLCSAPAATSEKSFTPPSTGMNSTSIPRR
jgi:ankyrin repeat protein